MSTNFIMALFKGHNWGSEHDPDTASCAPGVEQGGKYLMYQYSVSGYEHNNQVSVSLIYLGFQHIIICIHAMNFKKNLHNMLL